jgi:hypothetical protein
MDPTIWVPLDSGLPTLGFKDTMSWSPTKRPAETISNLPALQDMLHRWLEWSAGHYLPADSLLP